VRVAVPRMRGVDKMESRGQAGLGVEGAVAQAEADWAALRAPGDPDAAITLGVIQSTTFDGRDAATGVDDRPFAGADRLQDAFRRLRLVGLILQQHELDVLVLGMPRLVM